jgi:uncharacterized protein DUF4238
VAKRKTHKSQHFVPQCYTRAWLDPDAPNKQEYMWKFEKNGREGTRAAPKNTFEETDFYTIDEGGERNLALEKALGKLESRFVGARKRISNHEKLTSSEYAYFIGFIAAMSSRTKSFRDFQREQWGGVQELMESMQAQWEQSDENERKALLRASSTPRSGTPMGTLDDVRDVVKNPMKHMLVPATKVNGEFLTKINLTVFETDDRLGFITSDDPVVMYDPTAYRRPPIYRSPGFGRPEVELTMPLSPQQLALFTWYVPNGFIAVDAENLAALNRRTRAYADQYFIVCRNETRNDWFTSEPLPDDAWDKVHPKKKT